jgi:hypothetical protein
MSTKTPSAVESFNQFFDVENQIHEYFNYGEDWVKIPLVDHREDEWLLLPNEDGGGEVALQYNEGGLTEEDARSGNYTSFRVYTQRFLPKWVYETEDFTLISVATGVDGNRYLALFDNQKRVTSPAIIKAIQDYCDEMKQEMKRIIHSQNFEPPRPKQSLEHQLMSMQYAIRTYGQHEPGCPAGVINRSKTTPDQSEPPLSACNCGLKFYLEGDR